MIFDKTFKNFIVECVTTSNHFESPAVLKFIKQGKQYIQKKIFYIFGINIEFCLEFILVI